MNAFLEIENIPEVDNCLKLRVNGSSTGFSGASDCYVNEGKFKQFSGELFGFPKKLGQVVAFSSGRRDDLSYFELSFSCKSSSGHVLVRIDIHNIESFVNKPTKRQAAQLEFVTEPAELDRFQKSLEVVASQESVGKKARLNEKT